MPARVTNFVGKKGDFAEHIPYIFYQLPKILSILEAARQAGPPAFIWPSRGLLPPSFDGYLQFPGKYIILRKHTGRCDGMADMTDSKSTTPFDVPPVQTLGFKRLQTTKYFYAFLASLHCVPPISLE